MSQLWSPRLGALSAATAPVPPPVPARAVSRTGLRRCRPSLFKRTVDLQVDARLEEVWDAGSSVAATRRALSGATVNVHADRHRDVYRTTQALLRLHPKWAAPLQGHATVCQPPQHVKQAYLSVEPRDRLRLRLNLYPAPVESDAKADPDPVAYDLDQDTALRWCLCVLTGVGLGTDEEAPLPADAAVPEALRLAWSTLPAAVQDAWPATQNYAVLARAWAPDLDWASLLALTAGHAPAALPPKQLPDRSHLYLALVGLARCILFALQVPYARWEHLSAQFVQLVLKGGSTFQYVQGDERYEPWVRQRRATDEALTRRFTNTARDARVVLKRLQLGHDPDHVTYGSTSQRLYTQLRLFSGLPARVWAAPDHASWALHGMHAVPHDVASMIALTTATDLDFAEVFCPRYLGMCIGDAMEARAQLGAAVVYESSARALEAWAATLRLGGLDHQPVAATVRPRRECQRDAVVVCDRPTWRLWALLSVLRFLLKQVQPCRALEACPVAYATARISFEHPERLAVRRVLASVRAWFDKQAQPCATALDRTRHAAQDHTLEMLVRLLLAHVMHPGNGSLSTRPRNVPGVAAAVEGLLSLGTDVAFQGRRDAFVLLTERARCLHGLCPGWLEWDFQNGMSRHHDPYRRGATLLPPAAGWGVVEWLCDLTHAGDPAYDHILAALVLPPGTADVGHRLQPVAPGMQRLPPEAVDLCPRRPDTEDVDMADVDAEAAVDRRRVAHWAAQAGGAMAQSVVWAYGLQYDHLHGAAPSTEEMAAVGHAVFELWARVLACLETRARGGSHEYTEATFAVPAPWDVPVFKARGRWWGLSNALVLPWTPPPAYVSRALQERVEESTAYMPGDWGMFEGWAGVRVVERKAPAPRPVVAPPPPPPAPRKRAAPPPPVAPAPAPAPAPTVHKRTRVDGLGHGSMADLQLEELYPELANASSAAHTYHDAFTAPGMQLELAQNVLRPRAHAAGRSHRDSARHALRQGDRPYMRPVSPESTRALARRGDALTWSPTPTPAPRRK